MPPQEPLDVFILAGQSNMAGRGGVSKAPDRAACWDGQVPPECSFPPEMVWRLSAKKEWEVAVEPMHHDIDSPDKTCGVGPGLVFASEVLRLQQKAGVGPIHTIGLVPCAVGNTSITEWLEGGQLFSSMIEHTRAALAGGGALRALLWYQGESDARTQELAENYRERMEALVGAVRRTLGVEVPVIQVGVHMGSLEDLPFHQEVRKAQKEVAAPALFYVDAEGLELAPDRVHLTTAAQVIVGTSLARVYVHEILGLKAGKQP